MSESLNSARLKAGSSRCSRPLGIRNDHAMPNTSTVSPRPLTGSQPSCTPNTMMSISPTQKVGNEKPRMEPAMMIRPASECGRRPAHRPSGMPSVTAISIAITASSRVAGKRSRISAMAEVPWMNEAPSSPLSAPPRKCRYCCQTGMSRPSPAAVRAWSAAVACGSMSRSSGSPMT